MGVALVTASLFGAVVHLARAPHSPSDTGAQVAVSAIGKQIYTKHLPAIAGLKMFRPNPPNTSFEKATAKAIPIVNTCNGTVEGIIRANIVLVTKTASLTGSPRCLEKMNSTIL
jgi:hypothetical protein